MSIELRDFFAAHIAASLASRPEGGEHPEEVASQAYDLAEALLRERRFRDEPVSMTERYVDDSADEDDSRGAEPWADYQTDFQAAGLLDEPAPVSESDNEVDPSWYDREIDPTWEKEPRWDSAPPDELEGKASERPGIRSTRPPDSSDEKKHRSA